MPEKRTDRLHSEGLNDMQLDSLSWFPGHMTKTRRMIAAELGNVDAVCEIVDARIPSSSRNPDIDALTAVNTNRHFIGYETHQPFVDICNRRIAEAREKLLQAQTSVLEGLDDGDNDQRGDNERDAGVVQ